MHARQVMLTLDSSPRLIRPHTWPRHRQPVNEENNQDNGTDWPLLEVCDFEMPSTEMVSHAPIYVVKTRPCLDFPCFYSPPAREVSLSTAIDQDSQRHLHSPFANQMTHQSSSPTYCSYALNSLGSHRTSIGLGTFPASKQSWKPGHQ
jgi:hypothetical protein